MNIFQSSYTDRLESWATLRSSIVNESLLTQCVEVDRWWQSAPLVRRYLHIHDTQNWPDPWTLLHDNEYCTTARALGMAYSLHMVDVKNFELCEATDEYGDDVIIVACANYTMNWHPNTVVNTPLDKFRIKRTIDITHLLRKIK